MLLHFDTKKLLKALKLSLASFSLSARDIELNFSLMPHGRLPACTSHTHIHTHIMYIHIDNCNRTVAVAPGAASGAKHVAGVCPQ